MRLGLIKTVGLSLFFDLRKPFSLSQSLGRGGRLHRRWIAGFGRRDGAGGAGAGGSEAGGARVRGIRVLRFGAGYGRVGAISGRTGLGRLCIWQFAPHGQRRPVELARQRDRRA